jgi:hypothetical protein
MKANHTIFLKTGRGNSRGSSLAEFGPAMFLLLLLMFFPFLDLLSVCFAYGVVALLNYNQVHEASLLPSDKVNDPNGPVKKDIPDAWRHTGLAVFVKVMGSPNTTISYRDGQSNGNNTTEKIVIVNTTVDCAPLIFLPIPIMKVPGLNAPMRLSPTSERPMENADNALP